MVGILDQGCASGIGHSIVIRLLLNRDFEDFGDPTSIKPLHLRLGIWNLEFETWGFLLNLETGNFFSQISYQLYP